MNNFNITNIIMTILTFPVLYQASLMDFAWRQENEVYLTYIKRLVLLLPASGIVAISWLCVISIVSLIFRSKKTVFISHMIVVLWDFGRALLLYWLGIIQFIFVVLTTIGSTIRIFLQLIYYTFYDIISFPAKASSSFFGKFKVKGIPWPAVILTLIWSLLETVIFTYVMTPLVKDVLGGITGENVSIYMLQSALFLVFFLLILGSYSVISQFKDALVSKNISKIITLISIEVIVAFIEVIFFYREFVDALIPWFAQYAGENFSPGIPLILSIAFLAWLGIRAMTWFLFASEGIPTILAIIQRSGMKEAPGSNLPRSKEDSKKDREAKTVSRDQLLKDILWSTEKTDALINAFILPPLQILASIVNLTTLCLGHYFLFDLPLKNHKELGSSKKLLDLIEKAVTRP